MRKLFLIYLMALSLQYLFNPFVPTIPSSSASSDRRPQSVHRTFLNKDFKSPLYVDDLGLIVQSNGDGGDTAQRVGMFYYLHDDRAGFENALQLLEVAPGIYVRHPTQADFRSDPRRFSRDQQRPIVMALGKYGMRDRLLDLSFQHLLRLGKYQNLDFIGPVGVGEYARAFNSYWLYPIVLATDTVLFFGSLSLAASASLDPDDTDDNNHVMTLLQAQDYLPTPMGWLALKAYVALRPKNFGNVVLGKESAVQGALAWYHRPESGGNSYFGDAMYDAVSRR